MTIKIWLLQTSRRIIIENVENTYVEGFMYCLVQGNMVIKYPMCNIFQIQEMHDGK